MSLIARLHINDHPLVLVLLCAVVILGVVHNYFYFVMISRINGHPSTARKISLVGDYTGKFFTVQKQFRTLFPGDSIAFYAWATFMAGVASVILAVMTIVVVL